MSTDKGVGAFVSRYWPIIAAALAFGGTVWLGVNVHTRDISDLRDSVKELRLEVKELRASQTASSEKVTDALSDIRVKVAEAVAVLKSQEDRMTKGGR